MTSEEKDRAVAVLVELATGVRPGAADAARMAATVSAMRDALEQIAARSLFDTEPADLHSTLEALADDPGST